MRKKCPYLELFWSVFSRIRTEYREIKVISEYNKGMGGVDLFDMLLGSYRQNLRSKKWWWPLFVNALNIAVVGMEINQPKVSVKMLTKT